MRARALPERVANRRVEALAVAERDLDGTLAELHPTLGVPTVGVAGRAQTKPINITAAAMIGFMAQRYTKGVQPRGCEV